MLGFDDASVDGFMDDTFPPSTCKYHCFDSSCKGRITLLRIMLAELNQDQDLTGHKALKLIDAVIDCLLGTIGQ